MNTTALIHEFMQVASIAKATEAPLEESQIEIEFCNAPHRPPSRLPPGKMAVYVFTYGEVVLKVGKVGPNSNARYTSQHYNASSAPSTLAATLVKSGGEIEVTGLTDQSAGDWIRENTSRTNFLLNGKLGVPLLSLLEAFLHCRLKPKFEGFTSQR